ncbi:MAG TPA: DUF5915 domain-containing protein [Rickettsiales bacterium]|nr:DUF5915 domain-containing protein [Rickettsiales bacterium]
MENLNSIHLEDFPDLSNIKFDNNLVNEMDLIREICSTALFLRDRENLRVRLPLNEIKIIGQNLKNLENYKDIIADEINVKNVVFEENLKNIADFVLEVDLKKLGAKYGEKLKNIMIAVKSNQWKELDYGKIEVSGIMLEKDEYTIKLKPKNNAKNLQPLSNNKALIELDFKITPELELEGIARDLIRIIQQNRKDANLDLSDKIEISIMTNSEDIKKAIENNIEYIKKQTLSNDLKINNGKYNFLFTNEINKENITISFKRTN